MSDSEDDFMSDKFITSCVKEDIRPGLIYNKGEKRKHEILKKQTSVQLKKPKTYKEQENELRERGLGTALSCDNKGFQMLTKMGFKAGSSLGKQTDGLKEPISINLKTNTTGVGLEKRHKEIRETKQLLKQKNLKSIEKKFRETRQEKIQQGFLYKDYYKSQRICEELDFRNKVAKPVEFYYWTRETWKKMSDKKKDSDEDDDDDDNDENDDDEDETEDITQEKLINIISYLREKYLYCIYCAITGDNEEDLATNCPGAYREDHEDLN